MIMKTNILSYMAYAALATIAVSCSDNWTADAEGEGKGEGRLNTASILPTVTNEELFVEEIRGAQKAPAKAQSRSTIDLSNFIVDVAKTDGTPAASWKLNAMPSLPTFPVGDYTVTVRSHDVEPAAWNAPYFLGSQSFSITKGQLTSVETVVCKLANIRVSVDFDKKLLAASGNNGADFKITVTSTPGNTLTFTPEENRSGYFEATEGLSTMSVVFTGTVSGSLENTTAVLTNVTAGQHRHITMSLKTNPNRPADETGNIKVDGEGVNVDFSVKQEDMTANLEVEETPGNADDRPGQEVGGGDEPTLPTPSEGKVEISGGESFPDFNRTYNCDEYGPETKPAIINITAEKGIKALHVTIDSSTLSADELSGVGLAAKFYLDTAMGYNDDTHTYDIDLTEALTNLKFPIKENVVAKTEVEFNITNFMPLLVMLGEGNHNFILTVTDADGTVEEVTLKLKS